MWIFRATVYGSNAAIILQSNLSACSGRRAKDVRDYKKPQVWQSTLSTLPSQTFGLCDCPHLNTLKTLL